MIEQAGLLPVLATRTYRNVCFVIAVACKADMEETTPRCPPNAHGYARSFIHAAYYSCHYCRVPGECSNFEHGSDVTEIQRIS